MIDVSYKFNTLRYAKASGKLYCSEEIIKRITDKKIPKGDLLEVARVGGISAGKKTADIMFFCHSIPIDWIEINFKVEKNYIEVISEVKSVWKTGVEMEAITAVTGALLNMFDMLKPLSTDILISDIKVVKKRGGKSDFKDRFKNNISCAIVVISDSTFKGERVDKSGKLIENFLKDQPVDIKDYHIIPDSVEKIENLIKNYIDNENIDLIITTGGTGAGPKDRTPEAVLNIIDYEVPGIAEKMRSYGSERTPFASLSRGVVGVRKKSLIITMPGSSKGAIESMQAIFPGVLHIFPMLNGKGHDKKKG